MTPATLEYLIRLTVADRDRLALLSIDSWDNSGNSPELGAAILALRELLDLKRAV